MCDPENPSSTKSPVKVIDFPFSPGNVLYNRELGDLLVKKCDLHSEYCVLENNQGLQDKFRKASIIKDFNSGKMVLLTVSIGDKFIYSTGEKFEIIDHDSSPNSWKMLFSDGQEDWIEETGMLSSLRNRIIQRQDAKIATAQTLNQYYQVGKQLADPEQVGKGLSTLKNTVTKHIQEKARNLGQLKGNGTCPKCGFKKNPLLPCRNCSRRDKWNYDYRQQPRVAQTQISVQMSPAVADLFRDEDDDLREEKINRFLKMLSTLEPGIIERPEMLMKLKAEMDAELHETAKALEMDG